MTFCIQENSSSLQDRLTKNEMCGCSLIGYPRWLQGLASNKLFVLIISLQMCFIAAFSSIFEASVTTIETRYQMSISEIGLLTSVFTAGSIVSTVFVTHFGGRPTSRRPVWLAVSGLLVSLGIFLHTLPQFIFSPYQLPSSDHFTPSDSNASEFLTGLCVTDIGNMDEEDVCEEEDRQILLENNVAFIFFIIAEILVGIGYGPLLPVALSYVHDSVTTGTTGLVSGIFESLYGLGSIIGFLIAGGVLSLWVDFNRVDVINLTPYDYGWVGAWWFGFLLIAIAYFFLSLPLFLFPNRVNHAGKYTTDINEVDGKVLDEKDTDEEVKKSVLTNLKDWPHSVWRLLNNGVFCLGCLTFITEGALYYSMFIFFPKYIQDQFHINVFTAGIITGFALIPAWAVSALVGGILIKTLDLKVVSLAALGWISGLVSCGLIFTLIFVGCNNPPIAGVTVGYQGSEGWCSQSSGTPAPHSYVINDPTDGPNTASMQ